MLGLNFLKPALAHFPFHMQSREDNSGELFVIHHQLPIIESLISCVNMNWMALMVSVCIHILIFNVISPK